jgi:hypothetical protein
MFRGLDFRANSRPGSGRDQLSACCRGLIEQAFSDLFQSSKFVCTQTVGGSTNINLPLIQSEVRADLAGRSALHLRLIMINGNFAVGSSTKLSVPSLQTSFAQCSSCALVR